MAEDKPTKKPARRLRAPSQTVRVKAEKAQANADKPQKPRRLHKVRAVIRKPFTFVGKIFKHQPFRFIGLILYPRFLRNAFAELPYVTWPDRKTSRQLTFAVLAFALVFGVAIAGIDYALDKLFRTILLK